MPVLPSSFERRLAESPISCVSAGRNQVRFLSPQFTSMSWQPVSSVTTTCPSLGLFMSISRNPTERGCARHFNSQQKRLECTTALCASTIKKKCSNSLNLFQNYTHETLVEIAKRKEEMGFLRRPRLEIFGSAKEFRKGSLGPNQLFRLITQRPLVQIQPLLSRISKRPYLCWPTCFVYNGIKNLVSI
jgi:hypothetical protein